MVTAYMKDSLDIDMSQYKDRLLVKALDHIAESNPDMVGHWIKLAVNESRYNNFLTEEEAGDIVGGFKNDNGTTGPTWTFHEIKNAVLKNGLKLEDEPYFNEYALFVAINMFMSDHYKTLVKWHGSNEMKLFEICYDLACGQLRDPDRPNWVREYFHV